MHGPGSFQEMVDAWWKLEDSRCCDMENSAELPGGEVLIDDELYTDCEGVRKFTERVFSNGYPAIFASNVAYLDLQPQNFPLSLTVGQVDYRLLAFTSYNSSSSHFNSCIRLSTPYKEGWYSYDGMGITIRHGKRSNIRMLYVGSHPVASPGFFISTVFYIRCLGND